MNKRKSIEIDVYLKKRDINRLMSGKKKEEVWRVLTPSDNDFLIKINIERNDRLD